MILLIKIRKVQKEPRFRVGAVSSPAKFSPPGEAKKSHMGGFQPRLATLRGIRLEVAQLFQLPQLCVNAVPQVLSSAAPYSAQLFSSRIKTFKNPKIKQTFTLNPSKINLKCRIH